VDRRRGLVGCGRGGEEIGATSCSGGTVPEALALFCNQKRSEWKKIDIDVNSSIFHYKILQSIKRFGIIFSFFLNINYVFVLIMLELQE